MSDTTLTLVPWAPGTPVGAYPRRSEQLRPDGPPTGVPPADTQIVTDTASLTYDLADGEYWAAAPLNGSGTWQYVAFVAELPFDEEGHALAASQSPNGNWHEVMVDDIGRLSTVDLGPSQPPHGPPPYATLGDIETSHEDLDARLDAAENNVTAVSPKSFGGDPTGVVAADAAIASALASGLPVDLGGPENTWKLASAVIRTTDTVICGNGATIDMASIAVVDGRKSAFRVEGSPGTKTLLTANGTRAAKSVAVASVAGLSVGDWVQVGSNATYPTHGTNPIAARGEIKQIIDITGLTVTFRQYLYDDYATSDAAFLRELTMPKAHISGFRAVSDDVPTAGVQEYAVDLYLCNDAKVDVDTESISSQGVRLKSCVRFKIKGGIFSGSAKQQATEDATFYGIGLYDACQWGRIYGCHAENLRRLGANSCHSAGQDFYGCPRFLNVFGITGQHLKTELWEHHGFGEKIRVSDWVVDGCDGGVRIEGPGITVSGGQVTNWRSAAVVVSADCVDARDITIRDIDVWQEAANADSSRYAVLVDFTNATTRRNVWVEDIRVHDWTKFDGAAVRVTGSGVVENCGQRNIRVRCSGTTRSTYAVDVDPPGWQIEDGGIWNARYGIRLNGDSQEVNGGIYEGADAAAGQAIQFNGPNQRVIRARGHQGFAALNVTVNGTNWTAENNAFKVPSAGRCIVNGSNVVGRAMNNSWELASGLFSISSAASLTLSPMGSMYWQLTGTVTVNYVNSMTEGTEITIEAAAASTLAHNVAAAPAGFSKMLLNGGVNLVLSADDVVKLVYRGGVWRQAAPVSVN